MSERNRTGRNSRAGRLFGLVAAAALFRSLSRLFGRGAWRPPEEEVGVEVTRGRRGELPEEDAVALANQSVYEVRREMGRGLEPGDREPRPSPEDVRRRREERRRREAEEARR